MNGLRDRQARVVGNEVEHLLLDLPHGATAEVNGLRIDTPGRVGRVRYDVLADSDESSNTAIRGTHW